MFLEPMPGLDTIYARNLPSAFILKLFKFFYLVVCLVFAAVLSEMIRQCLQIRRQDRLEETYERRKYESRRGDHPTTNPRPWERSETTPTQPSHGADRAETRASCEEPRMLITDRNNSNGISHRRTNSSTTKTSDNSRLNIARQLGFSYLIRPQVKEQTHPATPSEKMSVTCREDQKKECLDDQGQAEDTEGEDPENTPLIRAKKEKVRMWLEKYFAGKDGSKTQESEAKCKEDLCSSENNNEKYADAESIVTVPSSIRLDYQHRGLSTEELDAPQNRLNTETLGAPRNRLNDETLGAPRNRLNDETLDVPRNRLNDETLDAPRNRLSTETQETLPKRLSTDNPIAPHPAVPMSSIDVTRNYRTWENFPTRKMKFLSAVESWQSTANSDSTLAGGRFFQAVAKSSSKMCTTQTRQQLPVGGGEERQRSVRERLAAILAKPIPASPVPSSSTYAGVRQLPSRQPSKRNAKIIVDLPDKLKEAIAECNLSRSLASKETLNQKPAQETPSKLAQETPSKLAQGTPSKLAQGTPSKPADSRRFMPGRGKKDVGRSTASKKVARLPSRAEGGGK